MRITKDEAAILWRALHEEKYSLNDSVKDFAKSKGMRSILAFEKLEEKLLTGSEDNRRNGRKSRNDFNDILKRFVTINCNNGTTGNLPKAE